MTQTRPIERCDQFMAFCLYALIFFLPISIALVELWSSLAIIFYLIKRTILFSEQRRDGGRLWQELSISRKCFEFLKSFKPVDSVLNTPILFFFFISIICVITSLYPHFSLEGFLGKILQNIFVLFACTECLKTKQRLKIFVTVLAFSCLLVCINGIWQYFTGKDFLRYHFITGGRIISSFRASNDFGTYLVLCIPVILMLLLASFQSQWLNYGTWQSKLFFLVALIFAITNLGLSFSRGAWLACSVSLLFVSLTKKRIFIWFLIFSMIFVLFFSILMLKERQYMDKKHLIFSAFGRDVYWQEAIHIIKDYPLFGTGINTYSQVAKNYKVYWGGYPHNCYLQMAAEMGLIGLGAFLWIMCALYRNACNIYGRIKDPLWQLVLLGPLVGLGGFLLHSFFDTTMYSVQLGTMMWLMMGYIVAILNAQLQL